MRAKVCVLLAVCAAAGCGLDVVGGLERAQPDSGIPSDAGVADQSSDASTADVGVDAAVIADAEAGSPDAGLVFAPSHVGATSYDVTAPDFAVSFPVPVEIDTTALTIKVGKDAAASSPRLVASGSIAVWSVGALAVDDRLTIKGSRPLAIVAMRDVSIDALVTAAAKGIQPGAGGAGPATGPSSGAAGASSGSNYSGGGGAGHAQIGGAGGEKGGQAGGAGGALSNAGGVLLLGGSGGGYGGGFVSASTCNGAAIGGAGGGALQISSAGKITIGTTGAIAVGGGGGRGGCRDSGSNQITGGGGGGAGGLVYLEAIGEIRVLGLIDARGGGGGEGGSSNGTGRAGGEPNLGAPQSPASGGSGGNGGNGGGGGVASAVPGAGATGDSAGGGGGGAGRVVFRTRGSAPSVSGDIAAVREDGPKF